MNDSRHERGTHKRKIGEGSCEHVGSSCVCEDEGWWTEEEGKLLLEHGEYESVS